MMFLLFLMLGAALGLGFRIGALVLFSVLAFATVVIASPSGGHGLLPAIIDAALAVAALQAGYLLSIFVKEAVANRVPRSLTAHDLNRIRHPPAGRG